VTTSLDQTDFSPAIAVNSDGAFVVTWERGSDSFEWDVYARAFRADGTALSAEVLVNTRTSFAQFAPTVGISDTGDFTVAWTTMVVEEDFPGWFTDLGDFVAVRRFSSNGTPLSDEQLLNPWESYISRSQWAPQIAVAPDGSALLIWYEYGDIWAQRFDPDGEEVEPREVLIHTEELSVAIFSVERLLSLARNAEGTYVVGWIDGTEYQPHISLFREDDLDSVYGLDLHHPYSFSIDVTLGQGYEWAAAVSESRGTFYIEGTGMGGYPLINSDFTIRADIIARPDGSLVLVGVSDAGICGRIYNVDNTPPVITSATYEHDAPRRVHLEFSEPVLMNPDAWVRVHLPREFFPIADVATPTTTVPVTSVDVALPSSLGDGNYEIHFGRLVSDLAGLILPFASLDIFILAGDANHDRHIDVADFKALTSNWMQTNRTFSQGDFNYDGTVNQADLDILSAKWNTTLPPYVDPVPTAAPAPTPSSSAKRTKTVASSVLG
jgi:hypothetical protein